MYFGLKGIKGSVSLKTITYYFLPLILIFLQSCVKEGNLLSPSQIATLSIGSTNSCKKIPVIAGMNANANSEIEGIYMVSISEDFLNGIEKRESFLLTDDEGSRYKIQNSEIFDGVALGTRVRINGFMIDPNQVVQTSSVGTQYDGPTLVAGSIQILNSPPQTMKTYSLKVLVVMMNFTDRMTTNYYSEQQAKTDIKDIADYYKRVSGGQMVMNYDVNGDQQPDVEVVDMGGSLNPNQHCQPDLSSFVQNKLVKHKISDYTTVVFVHTTIKHDSAPANDPKCGYGGVAYIGNLGSGINGRTHIGVPMNSVTTHELGHTFGLGHSGKPGCTYCDQVDPMGNYFGNLFQYFNGPKIKQLGLFDNHPHLEQEITGNGTYPISAVGLGVESANSTPRLLNIPNNAKTTRYYLTYRYPTGEDADLPSVLNSFKGVVVNTGAIGKGGESSYLQVLKNVGETFTGSGVTIKLVAGINAEETEVEVKIDGSTGGPTPPNPTPVPTPLPKCQASVDVKLNTLTENNGVYEVSYSVENKNDDACGDLEYELSVKSSIFELAEPSTIKVSPKKKVEIITALDLRSGVDITQITESDGELIGIEKSSKVPNFSISLKTKFGSIPKCK